MPTTYAKPVSSGPSVISTNLQLYVTECNWGYRPNYTYINILIYIYIIYISGVFHMLTSHLYPQVPYWNKNCGKNKTNNPQVLYMLELKQQLRTKTTTTTITNDRFPRSIWKHLTARSASTQRDATQRCWQWENHHHHWAAWWITIRLTIRLFHNVIRI